MGVKDWPRAPDWWGTVADEVCTGMDVPIGPWGAEEVAYWTGTPRYQPWKDVAAFFRESPISIAGVADG
jgi:hypothetical protein